MSQILVNKAFGDCVLQVLAARKQSTKKMPNRVFYTCTGGKKKAHKHKHIFPVTARVGGGSPDRVARGVSRQVARGQKFMCCVRNPRNINNFVRVPGERIGDRGDGEIVYVPNVYVPFPAPSTGGKLRACNWCHLTMSF